MAKARTVNRLFAILRLVEKLCKSGLLASSIVLMNKALGGCLIDLLYSCGDNFFMAVLRAELRDLLRAAFVLLTMTRFLADLILGIFAPPSSYS